MHIHFNSNIRVTSALIEQASALGTVSASHTDPLAPMLLSAPTTWTDTDLRGPEYAAELAAQIRRHTNDPTTYLYAGRERVTLTDHQELLASHGVRLLNPLIRSTHDLLEQKDEFLRSWNPDVLPCPQWRTWTDLPSFEQAMNELRDPNWRLCVKPAKGIYASGFRIIDQPSRSRFLGGDLYHTTELALRELIGEQTWPTMLLMHTLEGPECSTDAVAWQGQLLGAVSRQKHESCQDVRYDPALHLAAQRVAQQYNLSGVFNLQTKRHGHAWHVLEINARASGGLRYSLSAAPGHTPMNVMALLLGAAQGHVPAAPHHPSGQWRVTEHRTTQLLPSAGPA